MQKISTYLYPNRIQLLADLASFNVEYTNVYQKNVRIYKGIDNTLEFDIKNADQKRIELITDPDSTPARVAAVTNIRLTVLDAGGHELPNSPYTVEPSETIKGIAVATIPAEDLEDLENQYLQYSVRATKNNNDVLLYGDTRFGAMGKIELAGNINGTTRTNRVYDTFTAEIDLKGTPIHHSSAIPAKFYEAVPTSSLSFEVAVAGDVNIPGSGFVGSIWLEATTDSTISVNSFKHADYLGSYTAGTASPRISPVVFDDILVKKYNYFRISYQTPFENGIGATFTVTKPNNAYQVTIKSGGTGYAIGSQLKVLGSLVGGVDGINDLIINVDNIESFGSSYSISSILSISWTGTPVGSNIGTYIVTGTNLTGKIVSVTVS
jgi:hypothetical protein